MAGKGKEPDSLAAPRRTVVKPPQIGVDGFVEAAAEIGDRAGLVEAFRAALASAGFTHVVYYQILRNFERLTLEQGERIGPTQRRYTEIKSFDFEPWVAERIGAVRPFTWSDLPSADLLTRESRALMDEYRRDGLEDAVTIPVTLRAGDLAAFVVSRKGATFELPRASLLKLQLLCHAFHACYDALVPEEAHRQLSRRELDVMKLAAVGKTNAEIARELGVSVHTVNTLIRRSYVKLGATNRVEASIRLAYIARRGADD